ncbi:MAG: response regulator transcription factor [Acidimicrobiales bacterium]
MMAAFLLLMTVLTNLVVIWIAYKAFVLKGRIKTRFATLQASIVILLCGAALVSSIQDIGLQLTALGWVSASVGREFTTRAHIAVVLGGLVFLVPVLTILRRLTVEFARTEALTETLVGRLPEGVTIESAGLTQREIEVVNAVGAGNVSDRELATELTISPSTAATHVRNIMRKTGIKRRGDLTLLTIELGDGGD